MTCCTSSSGTKCTTRARPTSRSTSTKRGKRRLGDAQAARHSGPAVIILPRHASSSDRSRPMLLCPYCDHEVIEGNDECDECGQPLTDLHLPLPATEVELSLL